MVRQATKLAERIARRELWLRDYEERLTSKGLDRLYLRARPIAEVASVQFDDGDPMDAEEFKVYHERGYLYRRELWDATAEPLWIVRYFGGYLIPSMDPGDYPSTAVSISVDGQHVERAVWEIVQASYQADRRDRSVASESVGGRAPQTTSYFQDAGAGTGLWVPKAAEAILCRLGPVVT